jgi:hypothetical protein
VQAVRLNFQIKVLEELFESIAFKSLKNYAFSSSSKKLKEEFLKSFQSFVKLSE